MIDARNPDRREDGFSVRPPQQLQHVAAVRPGAEAMHDHRPTRPIRLGLLRDFAEEGWSSMDLVGEMIATRLTRDHAGRVVPVELRPSFRSVLGRLPSIGPLRGAGRNADRLINRMYRYPKVVARAAARDVADVFHVVDHSYGQLLHGLPPERTVVTCHDLDTFRCLLEPEREPRPKWFRRMASHILDGFRRAAVVVCVSEATRRAIETRGLIDPKRLRVLPNGVSDEYFAPNDDAAERSVARLLGPTSDDPAASIDLLHVGTTIPRKRIDVLLDVFAAVRRAEPRVRLIKVGHALTTAQDERARRLGIADAIVHLSGLTRSELAVVYRRAALVLQPSEAEGFGLPVAEAQACGAVVLASDLEVLREIGGGAAIYRPVAEVAAWTAATLELVEERRRDAESWNARSSASSTRASRWSWSSHVSQLVEIYESIGSAAR